MEQAQAMQGLVAQLDPDYRTPLVLRYWEELSYEEIATSLNMTVAAVKSRLFRARQQLMALYQKQQAATAPPSSGFKQAAAAERRATTKANVLHLRLGLSGL
jgi:predicted RNA polymerase sigma factor